MGKRRLGRVGAGMEKKKRTYCSGLHQEQQMWFDFGTFPSTLTELVPFLRLQNSLTPAIPLFVITFL